MPFVDGRLADGSRVHAVLGTLASPGTCISLRVPAGGSFRRRLRRFRLLNPGWRATPVTHDPRAKLAFLVSGGTGSGKTTLRL